MSTQQNPTKTELVNFVFCIYGKVNRDTIYETIRDLEFEVDLIWQDIYSGKGNPEEHNEDIRGNKLWIQKLYELSECIALPQEYNYSIN